MIEIWWKIDCSNLLDIGIDSFQKEEYLLINTLIIIRLIKINLSISTIGTVKLSSEVDINIKLLWYGFTVFPNAQGGGARHPREISQRFSVGLYKFYGRATPRSPYTRSRYQLLIASHNNYCR